MEIDIRFSYSIRVPSLSSVLLSTPRPMKEVQEKIRKYVEPEHKGHSYLLVFRRKEEERKIWIMWNVLEEGDGCILSYYFLV